MKDWPRYKVAAQVAPGSNVVIRDIRAPNLDEMKALLRRLMNITDLDTLNFFEVHVETEGGVEVIIGDPATSWDKAATVERHTVVYSPRVPGTAPHGPALLIKDTDGKERSAVIVGSSEPEPKPFNLLQALSQKSKERRARAAAENAPKENGRPVRTHKREVA